MYTYLFIVISWCTVIGVKNSAWSIETNLHITDFNPLFVNTNSFTGNYCQMISLPLINHNGQKLNIKLFLYRNLSWGSTLLMSLICFAF